MTQPARVSDYLHETGLLSEFGFSGSSLGQTSLLGCLPVSVAKMKKCGYCGKENEKQVAHCRECGTSFEMPDAAPSSVGARPAPASALPYALLVPVLAVLVHDAEASMGGWNWRHNVLMAGGFPSLLLLGYVVVMALLSFFVIRPFRERAGSRWVAFIACVAFFSAVLVGIIPKLAE